jgi:hypothetical protein
MGRHLKVLAVCALFFLVAALPASAGTIYNFSNVALTGSSGSSASGGFNFDPNTHVFSNVSISFNGGAFGGVQANAPNGQGIYLQGKGYLFSLLTTVQGNLVWSSILFDPSTGQFREWGGISNWKDYGGYDYMSVPEGGAELTYLLLSGIVVFGGILISGKQRRTARSSQSG